MSSLNCKIYETYRQEPSTQSTTLVWDHLGACETCRMAFESDDSPAREALSHLEFGEVVPLLREVLGAGTSRTPRSLLKHPALGPFAPSSFPISLPGYNPQRILGRGGSSEVWLAIQEGTERQVALKIMHKTSPGQKERMERECRILASVSHPHLLPIYASGTVGDKVWLALEYCPGGSLSQRVDRTWEPTKAADLVRKVALATQAIHDNGIIHRDIKPGNILIGADGEPRLADFDLARNQEAGQDTTNRTEILGTPAYIAPEQVKSKKVDARADVHALGGVLYHLLTGNAPFQAKSNYEALLLAVHTEPLPPIHFQPLIPRDLDQICRKCLAKDPRDRYATAGDLAEDLERFLEGKPVQARPLGGLEKSLRWAKRNPVGAAVILGAILALVSVTILSAIVAIQSRDFAMETGKLNDKLTKANDEVVKQGDKAQKEAQRAQAGEDRALAEIYRNRLAQAQVEFGKNNPLLAQERLEQCPSNLRGWEHDFFYSKILGNQYELQAFKNPVSHIKFLPSENAIFCSDLFGFYTKNSLTNGNIIASIKPANLPDRPSVNFVFNNNKFIGIGQGTGDFFINSTDQHRKQIYKTNFNSQITTMAEIKKRNIILIGCMDGNIYCLNYLECYLSKTIKSTYGEIRDIAVSPKEDYISVCCSDKKLLKINADTLSIEKICSLGETPGSVCYSPDGKSLVIGNFEKRESLTLRDAESLEFQRYGYGHKAHVQKALYSPDGMYIVSVGGDRRIIVWNPINLRPVKELTGHQAPILSLDIHPDKPLLATGCDDGRLILWNLVPHTQPTFTLRDSGNRIHSLIEDKRTGRLIAGTTHGELWFFRSDNIKPVKKIALLDAEEEIECLCFMEDLDQIAAGTYDGRIYIIDTNKDKIIYKYDVGRYNVVKKLFYNPLKNSFYCRIFNLISKKYNTINLEINGSQNKIIDFCDIFVLDNKETKVFEGFIKDYDGKSFGVNKDIGIFNFIDKDESIFGVYNNGALFYINKLTGKHFDFIEKYNKKSDNDSFLLDKFKHFIITSDNNWGFKLWDTKSGRYLVNIEDNFGDTSAISSSNQNNAFYIASHDRSLHMYQARLKCARAIVPVSDQPLKASPTAKPSESTPTRYSLNPAGDLVMFEDSRGFRAFETLTLKQIPTDSLAFPKTPITSSAKYRLDWNEGRLYLVDLAAEHNNKIYYENYFSYINSLDYNIDYILYGSYIFNRNSDRFFIDYNFICLSKMVVEKIKKIVLKKP